MSSSLFLIILSLLVYSSPMENETTYVNYFPIVSLDTKTKAGVAFANNVDFEDRVALLGSTVLYWRGWWSGSIPEEKAGLEPVPILWCDSFIRNGKVTSSMAIIDLLGPEYDGYLLFLNEPDMTFYGIHGQCEITPYRAAQLYVHVKLEMPNVKLVGPGVSHKDFQHNYTWLGIWWDHVVDITGEPPDISVWDSHTYISYGNPLAPYNELDKFLEERGVSNPVYWVTEWGACAPNRVADMKDAFDNDSRIQRHYWFDVYNAFEYDYRCMTLFHEESYPISLNDNGVYWINTAYNGGLHAP